MKPKHIALFLLAIVVGATAIGTLAGRGQASVLPRDPASDQALYQQLLRMQAAQDARLDRMEEWVARVSEHGPVRRAQLPARRQDTHPEIPQSAAQAEAGREQLLAQAERAFGDEAVAPGWSTKTKALIDQALSPRNLADKGAPAPRYEEASCRSRTCRIEVVYANEQQADVGQLMLYSDIGLALNRSTPFQHTYPDGSVQLTIYASSGGDSTGRR